MKKIQLIYFDAGGGHRASAKALCAALAAQHCPWDVQMVNLRTMLDPADHLRRRLGFDAEEAYNHLLTRGWTYGATAGLKLLQRAIALAHPVLVTRLRDYWAAATPDLVVSLIPNFNRALYEALQAAAPTAPYVTLLTDIADFPPHFWMEPGQRQSLICGSPKAVEQARALGYAEAQIFATSGMLLRPSFYDRAPLDKPAEKAQLGFDPAQPVGLVLFGGAGSEAMLTIAQKLTATQLILVCGHNDKLAERLRQLRPHAKHLVLGFSEAIPQLMQTADFFIGKPGPGSVSEAVHMHLPVIVESNARTLPQERYNAHWVQAQGIGLVLKHFHAVKPAVETMLADLDSFRARTRMFNNRAIFEVPALLTQILERDGAQTH